MSLGGGKSKKSAKVSKATLAVYKEAAPKAQDTAKQLVDFTKDYQQTVIAPAVAKVAAATDTGVVRNSEVFNTQSAQAQQAQKLFDDQGQPLIKKYADTINDFSTDAYADRQAALGIGDVRNQQAVDQGTQQRRLQAIGVNPTSGRAISANRSSDTQYAIAAAAQAARARDLATSQKLNLQQSGANMGLSIAGLAPSITKGQVDTVGQGSSIPAVGLGAISGAAAPTNQGYSSAGNIYTSLATGSADSASKSAEAADKAAAAESGGFGDFLGTVAGIGAKALL